MSIDRSELERLLADRPAGNRSAMQAVRESYADIVLMRERGLSWAEISDLLAKLGITARDSQPISPVTLRSAFFLVGSEGRGEAGGDHGGAAVMSAETLAAVHEAALTAGKKDESEETGETADSDRAEEAAAASAGSPPDQPPVEMSEAQAEPTVSASEPSGEEPAAPAPSLLARLAKDADEEPDTVPEPASETPEPDGAREVGTEKAQAPDPEPEPTAEPAPPPVPQPTSTAAAQNTGSLMSPPMHQDDSTNAYWKGDRMLGTIFVLNDRGGVGKTLLSHHLMATAMLEGLQLKVVEYEVNERLARLFGPDVVEHRRITQDFMNMMGSGDGFYEFWDLIGPELQRGGRLYDFGGNISQWFFNWAEVSGFDYYVGDGERLTFMVPVTVDLASLSTGMTTLERVATIAPKAKRVLVENGFSGPFSQLEDSQYARRKAEMVEREGLQVISMSPCTAPAWARLTGHRLDQVATMTREDLVKLGMTPPVASRSLIIIHEWLRNMRQALSPYLHDAFRQTPATAKAR
ncbi:hypothetical protein A6A40_05135 [Azospirillum humicireducens]|uniref:Uncharacterized protein n=1 Tax=Azospirillum humicireducens TaxID=1226968 RepID=A0A168Y3R5_9PROT|nr:hypothetical protein [Azospirillum humicireducens]ANC91337.1 hypothetical protein A6A40_05135 [Azospirillum humicireducens]